MDKTYFHVFKRNNTYGMRRQNSHSENLKSLAYAKKSGYETILNYEIPLNRLKQAIRTFESCKNGHLAWNKLEDEISKICLLNTEVSDTIH